jgi:DNA-directed RNA polymerase specialized sigma24 family protein
VGAGDARQSSQGDATVERRCARSRRGDDETRGVRPRKSQLAELRCFGGLSLKEAGEALGISIATAERDWQAARAWLLKELRGKQQHDA